MLRYLMGAASNADAFAPGSLWATGEQGFWYDPSDLSTMFQDTAATVPVTAPGQIVARINDKSGRGNHAVQSNAARRMALAQDSLGNYYLDASGGAKFYDIPSIPVSTDKATLWLALRNDSAALRAIVFETSPDYGRNGAIGFVMPHANGQSTAAAYLRGTTESAWSWAAAVGDTQVASVAFDIAGATRVEEILPRSNGRVQPLSPVGAAVSAGTGNFIAQPYTLGARQGATLPFVGRIYGAALRFASSTNWQIASFESWLAVKSGISFLTGSDYLSMPLPSNATLTLNLNFQRVAALQFSGIGIGAVQPGGQPRPQQAFSNGSITHPKILDIPARFAGYRYWMAATPYFGVFGSDSQWENPHVWASNDGVNFVEPLGINNPLDLAENEFPNHSYWSDTHLLFPGDGYLYCYYRGVGSAFGAAPTNYYRRTLDGVNWGPRTLLCSSNGTVSPVAMKTGANEQVYYEVRLTPTRSVQRIPMPEPGVVADKALAETCTFNVTPWAADQGFWHIDVDRIGGLTLMLINTGPVASSGGNQLWFAYSADGLNFTVIPTPLASSAYRSTFIPYRVTESAVSIDLFVAATSSGAISGRTLILNRV